MTPDPTDESWRKTLEVAVSNQIKLGVEAIFSGVFSGPSPSSLSFHHLLNRVMMVAQVPITFMVFYHSEDGIKEVYRANNHPRHRRDLDKVSDQAHENIRHMIPLWRFNSQYKLLVIKADDYRFNLLQRREKIPEKPNTWDLAAYKIEKVLDGEQYKAYGAKFFDYVLKAIERVDASRSTKRISRNIQRATPEKWFNDLFETTMLRHDTRWAVLGRGIIDRIFAKLEKNILSIANPDGSDGKLTNFILFSRDYAGDPSGALRYGCYDYRLRIMLGSRQEEEVKRHLRRWMKGGERYTREKNFLQQVDNIADKSSSAGELAKEVSEEFWRLLSLGDSGVNKVVENIGAYFSENARSIADPVFDGVSFFRAPFTKDAGMGRCFDSQSGKVIPDSFELVRDQGVRDDLLRIVTCQYVFESMATRSDDGDGFLQIMLNPLEVGGRVWGVVGYVTRSRNADVDFSSVNEQSDFINSFNSYWLQNYHIYQDVNERMKKNLRTYLNRFYETAVAKVYSSWLKKWLDDEELRHKKSADSSVGCEDVCRDLILSLEKLSCYFPYDVVKGELKQFRLAALVFPDSGEEVLGDGDPVESARTAVVAPGWGFVVDTEAASCFPDAPGGCSEGFVDEVDVAVAMTEEVLRSAYEELVELSRVAASTAKSAINSAMKSRGFT